MHSGDLCNAGGALFKTQSFHIAVYTQGKLVYYLENKTKQKQETWRC